MLNLCRCCMSMLCNAVRNCGCSALGDHTVADLLLWKAKQTPVCLVVWWEAEFVDQIFFCRVRKGLTPAVYGAAFACTQKSITSPVEFSLLFERTAST